MGEVWTDAVIESTEVEFAGFVEISDTVIREQIERCDLDPRLIFKSLPEALDKVKATGDVKIGVNIVRRAVVAPIKQIADRMGYTAVIEASGAKFAADTCCVVAPLKGRFNVMATDSAKACYYAQTKNRFRTVFRPFDEIVQLAIAGGHVEQGGKA